tara:strand:+ start:1277 stop:2050 length:774 start_codon:yes stop_codon:yes gene_type:complete
MKNINKKYNIHFDNVIKYFLILIILIIILQIIIGIYEFSNLCDIFSHKFKNNKYGEMVRQIQRASCGYPTDIPIHKFIYYNSELIGAITDDILVLKGSSTILDCLKDISIERTRVDRLGTLSYGPNTMFIDILPQIVGENINTITGWSLGAMIGAQLSLHIYKNSGKKTNNIFFGLPPFVNKEYQTNYNLHLYENTVVYNNNRDPIAYPFTGNNIIQDMLQYLSGYYQVGRVISNYPYSDYYKKHWYSIFSYHISYF